jgi:hypothetical protein
MKKRVLASILGVFQVFIGGYFLVSKAGILIKDLQADYNLRIVAILIPFGVAILIMMGGLGIILQKHWAKILSIISWATVLIYMLLYGYFAGSFGI